MTRRSCDELGVCQVSTACSGRCTRGAAANDADATAFFAPGAIEGGPSRRRAARMERIARATAWGACALGLGAAIGVVGGWVQAGGFLP